MTDEKRRQIITAYRNVFSHPEAGIVLNDLAEVGEFYKPSFRNANPEGTAYGEGKRSMFLRILQFSGLEESIRGLLERKRM